MVYLKFDIHKIKIASEKLFCLSLPSLTENDSILSDSFVKTTLYQERQFQILFFNTEIKLQGCPILLGLLSQNQNENLSPSFFWKKLNVNYLVPLMVVSCVRDHGCVLPLQIHFCDWENCLVVDHFS